MKSKILYAILLIGISFSSCKLIKEPARQVSNLPPANYEGLNDSALFIPIQWKSYFKDTNLISLIDQALSNNQELNMMLREIEINKNEVLAKRGEYQPLGYIEAGVAKEKSGKYTWDGISEEDAKKRSEKVPPFVGNQYAMLNFSWEIDIWKKLRNARESAVKRYLSSIEGKNFMLTNLVAEIANAYFELIVFDNELAIVNQNIALQKDALEMVNVQKDAAKVNQLAVNRFMGQLLNTENLRFEIQQQITETENKINMLVARYPQPIKRNAANIYQFQLFNNLVGTPGQLLSNRPDIKQAELELQAAKLDIAVARARFYPSFMLGAGVGLNAFNPAYLINPQSLFYNIAGGLAGPLINRKAIKASYFNTNERQIQKVFNYEEVVLNAYLEVSNQMAGNKNYTESFATKLNQVEILSASIDISNNLFKSARADYTEVLLTQREALEAKMDLMEIKRKQLNAEVNIYKALGGGWR